MDASTQNADTARRWYDRLSGVYDSVSESSERPARMAALRLLNARPGERVLEIGPGTGHGLVCLAHAVGPKGFVVGVDLSQKMLDACARKLEEEGLAARVQLVCDDALEAQWDPASFDAVFMSFSLELFPDEQIVQLLQQTREALKPGGRLCVVGLARPQGLRVGGRIYEALHKLFPRHIDCRPIESDTLIQQAGFRLEVSEPFSLWGIPGNTVLAKK